MNCKKNSYVTKERKDSFRATALAALLLVVGGVFAVGNVFGKVEVVETRNTSLVLERDNTGSWVLSYYGARLSNANDAGATVFMCDINAEGVTKAADEINALGKGKAYAVVADASASTSHTFRRKSQLNEDGILDSP